MAGGDGHQARDLCRGVQPSARRSHDPIYKIVFDAESAGHLAGAFTGGHMTVDEVIEAVIRKIDEGECYRDPMAFVSARLLLRNDLLKAIEEERDHASV